MKNLKFLFVRLINVGFKITADRYRNRRKRFGLRFNLIAGVYNFDLQI